MRYPTRRSAALVGFATAAVSIVAFGRCFTTVHVGRNLALSPTSSLLAPSLSAGVPRSTLRSKESNEKTYGYAALLAGTVLSLAHLWPSGHKNLRRKARHSRTALNYGRMVLLDDLQGLWKDHEKNVIEVTGDIAKCHLPANAGPSPSPERFLVTARGVQWAGGVLHVDTPGKPSWKSPNGTCHEWVRPEKTEWEDCFHEFKDELLQLRKQLWAKVAMEDYSDACSLRDALAEGGNVLRKCTPEQQLRLEKGRQLTTGVCFVHRKRDVRGVIIACEPLHDPITASLQNVEVGTPGYHCLLDESCGGAGLFLTEDEIMPTRMAFPVHNPQFEELLVPCPEIGGYLPRPKLSAALQQQRSCRRFTFHLLNQLN